MSSNNIFLSISVFLNLVLLALFWATLSGTSKDTADLAEANKTLNTQKQALTEKINEQTLLKNKIGLAAAEIGSAEDAGDGTIMGEINSMIARGGVYAQGSQTVDAAVSKMYSELTNQKAALEARQKDLAAKIQEFNAMVAQKDQVIAQHLAARTTAENTVKDMVKSHGEEIDSKDVVIQEVRTQLNEKNTELETVKAEKDAIIADLNDRVTRQAQNLTRIKKKLFELDDESYEIADGKIVFVDRDRKVVTINLGSADGLQEGNSFSVYTKSNSGIGRRDTEDIKGKIEVTSIKGPHRAEARILDPDKAIRLKRQGEDPQSVYARKARYGLDLLLNPMAIGDPIYSPAFNRGSVEQFSIVGLIDVDQDGKSDRELLRNLISAHGAKIDNEIGDDGVAITTNQISYKTKFLVVGDLGDQDGTEDAKRLAAYRNIQVEAKRLREEAEDAGVRIMSLRAFLEYLGYQSVRGPWIRGEDYDTKLKAGAASDGVSGTLGDRKSQGNVTGLYDPARRRALNVRDRLRRSGNGGNVSGIYKKR